MRRGAVTVHADDNAVTVEDQGVRRVLTWGDGVHLRRLTTTDLATRVDEVPGLEITAWYLEIGHDDGGVSLFDTHPAPEPPRSGRAMVIVQRT